MISYHLLKLLFKLLFAAIIVIEGLGLEEVALILLNFYLSLGLLSILFFYDGGFYIYFGNGFKNP